MSDHDDYEDERADQSTPLVELSPKAHSTPNIVDTVESPVTPPRLRPHTYTPTPLKGKAIQLVSTPKGVVDDAVKQYVKGEFIDKIHRDYPVADFVRAVWNYEPKHIPNHSYALPAVSVKKYCETTERPSYEHLIFIFENLMAQVYSHPPLATDGPPVEDPRSRILDSHIVSMKDRKVDGNYANFKPDFGFITTFNEERQHWDWCLAYAEVKKPTVREVKYPADISVEIEKLRSPHAESAPFVSETTSTSSSGRKRKQSSAATDPLERPRKRSRSNTKADSGLADTHRTLTGNEVQSAKYINEMLSHGVRSYGSGLLIQDFSIKLWYADRMGLVISKPLDMFFEPEKLLLVVAALGAADLSTMGICPFLKFPSTSFESYDGAKLVFPTCITDDTEEVVEFQVDTSRKVDTEFGAVGRGTTIVPIKAVGSWTARFGSEELVAKLAWPPASRDGEDRLIKLIRCKLQKDKPQYLKHVVDLKCSVSRTMEEMRLPRAFMNGLIEYEPRVFRLMVMEKYEPLEQVNSVDEFAAVIVDVVRAHHWVWETASILHRDISASNIMLRKVDAHVVGVLCDWDLAMEISHEEEAVQDYPDDGGSGWFNENDALDGNVDASADKDDAREFDTAKDQGAEASQKDENAAMEARCRARYRTGTGPFMSLELLTVGEPPRHRYRFDLESFFFVIAWFCAVFDPERHTLGHLYEWESGDLYTIGRNKSGFLSEMATHRNIFSRAHASYQPLWKKWVKPLYSMFSSNHSERNTIHSLGARLKDARDEGLKDVEERLSADIARRRIWIEQNTTYEAFMAILKAPMDVLD